MLKRLFAILLLSTSVLMTNQAMADAANPVVGTDFNQTQQIITTDNPAKIEVMELFWYGCPHCYHLEPSLAAWVKKLPADVYFKRVPAVPRADWAPMAKTYFAMEQLGLQEKLHVALFDAIHKQKTLNPSDEKAALDWLVKASGMDRKKVEEAFNSFSLNTKMTRAMQTFRASGATGVPSLIIDGQYITSSTMAGGNEEVLKVADFIIQNVRKDKAATAKK